jgi:hypothetical protein
VARPVMSVVRGLSLMAARTARAAAVAAAVLIRAHLPPIVLSMGRASLFASTLVHLTLSPCFWMLYSYGWTGQQSGSGFCDLAPSILHYNWF